MSALRKNRTTRAYLKETYNLLYSPDVFHGQCVFDRPLDRLRALLLCALFYHKAAIFTIKLCTAKLLIQADNGVIRNTFHVKERS